MVCLLLGAILATDARPTASDAAVAVELSRMRYFEAHSPPSKAKLDEARARHQMSAAAAAVAKTQFITEKNARLAAVAQIAVELERLRGEIADAVRQQQQSRPDLKQLDAFDVSRTTPGGVGQLRFGHAGDRFRVRCEQILGNDTSVVTITQYSQVVLTRHRSDGGHVMVPSEIPKVSATVFLKRYPTVGMEVGRELAGATIDLIAVGREVAGLCRPLPALEVFDSTRPFK